MAMIHDDRQATLYTANLLGALAMAVSDTLREEAERGGDGAASAAIVRIATHQGRSIDFLSQALQLSHSATVRVVDRLEERGLVRRERLPEGAPGDRRAVGLYLTDDGERRLREVLGRRYEALEAMLHSLTAEEREWLRTIAGKLLSGIATPESAGHICRLCDEPTCSRVWCPVPLQEGVR